MNNSVLSDKKIIVLGTIVSGNFENPYQVSLKVDPSIACQNHIYKVIKDFQSKSALSFSRDKLLKVNKDFLKENISELEKLESHYLKKIEMVDSYKELLSAIKYLKAYAKGDLIYPLVHDMGFSEVIK